MTKTLRILMTVAIVVFLPVFGLAAVLGYYLSKAERRRLK